MVDEMKRALTSTILPALSPLGFRKRGTRDLLRIDGPIVQRLYFQLTAWGGRDFCTTCCVNLVPADEIATLQPGFRLGGGKWLPSLTDQQAADSAALVLRWIMVEAIPFFERSRTLLGYEKTVAGQEWGAEHHQKFRRAVALALSEMWEEADQLLQEAKALYLEDGRDWVGGYIARIDALAAALQGGTATDLLQQWTIDNSKAHRI
jgi:hypothetical protein